MIQFDLTGIIDKPAVSNNLKICMKNYLCKNVRKVFICILFAVFFTKSGAAQLLHLGTENLNAEVGINFGPSFFLGDLGVDRNTTLSYLKTINDPIKKFMKGAYISIYPREWFGVRFALQYTFLEGNDNTITSLDKADLYRKKRNLDFRSTIWEAYTAVEFFPLMYFKHNDIEYAPKLRPYLFAGIGIFHFNPQGSLTDQNGNKTWHDLQPLHTEGQGFPEYPNRKMYSLTQMNIPFGVGLKYKLTEKVNLGAEILYRKTFTDYIDDVSTTYINPKLFNKYLSATDAYLAMRLYNKSTANTGNSEGQKRGNPDKDDAYFSFNFKLGIRLSHNFDSDDERNAAKGVKCPVRF